MVRPESFKIKGSQTLAVFKCYCAFPGHCHCTKLIFHFTESKELQVEMELNWIFWWFSWTNSQATCKWIKKHNTWLKYCIKNIMYDNKCILTKQFTQKNHLIHVVPICFFLRTHLKKFSCTLLACQWILCSEWVRRETKHLIKTTIIQLQNIH